MFIIGISGGSGSGKTSLLRSLSDRFSESEVAVISQDDYYHPVDQSIDNHLIEFDRPEALDLDLLAEDIRQLRSGSVLRKMEYTFNNEENEPSEIEILPAPVLLVEGIFVFYHEGIRSLCDRLVYIGADESIRFDRRLRRDMKERGYCEGSIRYKWEHQVERGFKEYLEPLRPLADLQIDSTVSIEDGVIEVTELICSVLERVK